VSGLNQHRLLEYTRKEAPNRRRLSRVVNSYAARCRRRFAARRESERTCPSDTVDLVRKFKLLFVGLPLSALLVFEKSSSHRQCDAVAVRQWNESRRLASEAKLRTLYSPVALSLPKDGKRHYPGSIRVGSPEQEPSRSEFWRR
jgi:hypothetical protein